VGGFSKIFTLKLLRRQFKRLLASEVCNLGRCRGGQGIDPSLIRREEPLVRVARQGVERAAPELGCPWVRAAGRAGEPKEPDEVGRSGGRNLFEARGLAYHSAT